MESLTWYVVIAVVLLVSSLARASLSCVGGGRPPPRPTSRGPALITLGVGDDDSVPRDTPRRSVIDVATSVLDEPDTDADAEEAVSTEAVWEVEAPEPTKGRLHRLASDSREATTPVWARCSPETMSTRTPGSRSKRSCSPQTSVSRRPG